MLFIPLCREISVMEKSLYSSRIVSESSYDSKNLPLIFLSICANPLWSNSDVEQVIYPSPLEYGGSQ